MRAPVKAANAPRRVSIPSPRASAARPSWPNTGRWDGPEGTFLNLSRSGAHYTVVIQDLDGPRTFDGVDDHGRVRFVRDGKTEFLTAGDGEASGMKWLADKKHCLLTRRGEGWCRD